jgi:hypothetical protein
MFVRREGSCYHVAAFLYALIDIRESKRQVQVITANGSRSQEAKVKPQKS